MGTGEFNASIPVIGLDFQVFWEPMLLGPHHVGRKINNHTPKLLEIESTLLWTSIPSRGCRSIPSYFPATESRIIGAIAEYLAQSVTCVGVL